MITIKSLISKAKEKLENKHPKEKAKKQSVKLFFWLIPPLLLSTILGLMYAFSFSLFFISDKLAGTISFYMMSFTMMTSIILGINAEQKDESYKENYSELTTNEKLTIKNWLIRHPELIEYNQQRVSEAREWMQFDYTLIKEYLEKKNVQTIDNELNQMTKTQESKAKYLTSAL